MLFPRKLLSLLAAFALLAVMVNPVFAAPMSDGFQTAKGAYITLDQDAPQGAMVIPIISVGEEVDGVLFTGIPDGIGLVPGEAKKTVDVYVNHEESTVPFRGERDFQAASVTKWTLSTKTGNVLSAEVAIPSSDGYLRFCSASVAGPAEGFDDFVFLTGEETSNVVPVAGGPYPADPAFAPDDDRQGGFAVVLNTATGVYDEIAGMGRHNHENTVAVPGYDQIVTLSTDDTFTAATSQFYMYNAADQDALFADEGTLYAFRATAKNGVDVDETDPFNDANDYLDIRPGDVLEGEFIPVPEAVAKGTTADAPQDALEDWSNANNVFQFVRLEDLAYDKNHPHTVYVADTGASRVQPDPTTGRMHRPSGAPSLAGGGSMFQFDLNPDDPLIVDSFTVLAQGDDPIHGAFVDMESPDNIDTSKNSLMVQEDADDAVIWQYYFANKRWAAVASVNDTGGESSGIVDASDFFGPGWWLLDVQAHDFPFIDEDTTSIPGTTIKLEDGQLLLMKIPGS